MSSSDPTMTLDEMVESLTGFDELAIEKHFDGFDVYTQGETKSIRAMRALAFVQFRRDGEADRDALKSALGLSFKDLSSRFLPDEPEIDPDEPETPSGKDSTPLD